MSEEQKLSRAEWERERARELETKSITDLAGKVAALEFDLKAKRGELDTLKAALPPEGSVVLKGADRERWEAYSALGKPDDLKAAVAERDTLTAQLAQRERRDALRAAAEAAGFKPAVLERLAPDGVTFEVRDVEADGKTARVAFVKDAEGKETPLADYAAAHYADFLPALQAAPAPAPQPAPGVTFPAQRPTTPASPPLTVAELAAQKAQSGEYSV